MSILVKTKISKFTHNLVFQPTCINVSMYRERNEFCKKCVNITKKQNTKSNVKAIKKPFGYPAFSSSRVQTKSPAYSKPVIKNEQVELGPFATLLRDLIKANTFID